MDENKNEIEKVEEEKVIRHTINAEETFTLAKDVFDLRCFLKNVYNNRAVIARRLNLFSLIVSLVFTVLYMAYIMLTGIIDKINTGGTILLYVVIGVYAAVFVIMLIGIACGASAKTKSMKVIKKLLAICRLIVRLLSLGLTITALALLMQGGDFTAQHVAIDIALVIFSIFCLIIAIIPLIAGGLAKLSRWLLSPVKIKYHFSAVALEWYELVVTEDGEKKAVKKVSQKYHDDIGRCLDNYLIPLLGKKYVNSIKPATILRVAQGAQSDKLLIEGILKSIFAYATDCGYVTFDPCKDLEFVGSIEEEEKPKTKIKEKFLRLGGKIGKSMIKKYIEKNIAEGKED
ncbi:MAG: hypothetical protein K2J83_07490, partial [Clostridia bacterium]|nr:hypothetical protein [Clostridia bacterium]